MARGVSTKLLTKLPQEYSPDWLERLDKRTKIWRAILPRIQRLEEDAGGTDNLDHAKRSLCRRAAFLDPVRDAGAALHGRGAGRRGRLHTGVQLDAGRLQDPRLPRAPGAPGHGPA